MSHRRAVLGVALLAVSLLSAPAAAADTDGWQTHEGTIDGAQYLAKVPDDWNGTLVLYSHGYYPPGFNPGRIFLANRPDTEEWLLDHGYALAASWYLGVSGAVYDRAQVDQLNLLDWFTDNVGQPERTVATGSSSGAAVSLKLAESNPERFDGVLGMCGPLDINGEWNRSLDITFAIKTLLAPPGARIDLVRPGDNAFNSANLLTAAVTDAVDDPAGRARLALVNALGNVDGWNSAVEPRPDGLVKEIEALAAIDGVFIFVTGPLGRPDLEQRAGGNPSGNVGVDYRRQLARSAHKDLVWRAYKDAGLGLKELNADLDKLAAAPRVAADPVATDWLVDSAVAQGTTPVPVLTVHGTADSASVDNEKWYAGRVRQSGNPNMVRQVFTERATHCAFTAAEEIVALNALLAKLDTGHWPDLRPRTMNAAASRLPAELRMILDFPTQKDYAVPPAYTRFTPPNPLRPTR